jgi:hypothetical protein
MDSKTKSLSKLKTFLKSERQASAKVKKQIEVLEIINEALDYLVLVLASKTQNDVIETIKVLT